MSRLLRVLPLLLVLGLAGLALPFRAPPPAIAQEKGDALDKQFATTVQPLLAKYCHACHGPKKQAGSLDLSLDATPAAVAKNAKQWELAFERIHAKEMPPETSTKQPTKEERDEMVKWFRDLRAREAQKHAGDPGTVLARRLSSAEFDNTIRDLTGVDIRPTREFPVDPANQSGFDNSGESLTMSPALLKKYLAAARHVADHMILKPEGFVFAPHPAVTDTDRDKYAVGRILDFYKRHEVDLADYFLAAWQYKHRAKLGKPAATLDDYAADAKLSEKYLALVWQTLAEPAADAGPLAVVKQKWDALPAADPAKPDAARGGCGQLRDLIGRLRKQLKPTPPKLAVNGISDGTQAFILARDRFLAANRRRYTGEVAADFKKLAEQVKGDDSLAKLLTIEKPGAAAERALRADLECFCSAFPDYFVMADRSTNSSTAELGKNRPLTAGFHLMQGYFRDDTPLCELILTDRERRELDALWFELDFVTLAPMRQYKDYIFFERAEPPRFMFEAEFDFARSEDKDCTSEAKMMRLEEVYLAKAKKKKASDAAVEAIQAHFANISAEVRRVEKARLAAEPSHLEALAKVAERAYRRPLKAEEKADLLAFYKQLRTKGELSHEDAIRDCIASVLLSPHVCYRVDLAQPGVAARPLDDHELASRLSYFLWSSMPDEELLARAAAGDLHKPEVLTAQAQRMLRDPKVRGLATEFAGNFFDFRRFEEHNAVDRERFPQFTNELRQAMFEEPVRYFIDIAQRNRSVLDLLHGTDTFVNRPLAKHYGMPEPSPARLAGPTVGAASRAAQDDWVRVENADRFGRGGILPMAVFQTKNAPGLRTSPVKRGYWVVSKVLGERIPPPPPTVPELPKDESKLGDLTLPQVLARHRADKACEGCHNRFDAVGLVFEGFGPVGELREKDLGGKPVATTATFPDAKDRTGLAGLRSYLREKRQDDFLDNLSRKLLSYALGRSLLLSDEPLLIAMKARLTNDKHAFGTLVESIVTSPQFLNKRGRDDVRE
jgi:mono/diheme cytochrome c family protein